MLNQLYYNKSLIGQTVEVLFEDREVKEGVAYYKGHTQNYIMVKYETSEELENCLKDIKVLNADSDCVIG